MRTSAFILALLVPFLAVVVWAADAPKAGDARAIPPLDSTTATRFGVVDIFVDAGEVPLAAFEFEFSASVGDVKLVGVERGDDPNFQDPPYYDETAMQQDRVIVGGFSLADQLPQGRTRVARLHVRIGAGSAPQFNVKLRAAGSREGVSIPAQVTFKEAITEGESR